MAPLDSALPTDDAYLSTSAAKPVEPVEADASQYVEGWGARPELRGARGAPSVAIGDNSMPPVTEKMKLPAERYDHLEKENPELHQMIDKAATDVGVPAIDLANIAYASSGFKSGTPGGYMNITPQDAKQLDPTGKFDPNDPVYNVYLGALKYKNLSDQYGVSTSSALGAYGADPATIEAMGRLSPEDQRKHYPEVYDYLRRLSAGITGKKPGMTAVPDEPSEMQNAPTVMPDAARGAPYTGAQVPENTARRQAIAAANAPELQQAPTDVGGDTAARRQNLELLGRVADRSNAPLPPVSEMQNPPTDLAQVDQARNAELRRSGGVPGMDVEPVRPEFQPPGSQGVDPLTGQRRAPLPEPTTTVPEMVRAGGRAVADTARSAVAGVGSALAGAYGPTTPTAAQYQPPSTPPPTSVPPDASKALTAALAGPLEMTVPPTVVPPAPPAAALPGPPPPKPDAPAAWPPAAVAGNPPPGAAPLPGAPGAPPATGTSTPPAAPAARPTSAPGAPAGAPAAAAAPAASAPGQPTAAQLNQDELARIRAGQPPGPPGAPIPNVTTPSGAISQPVGQGGAGPAAPAVGADRPAGEPPPIHGSGTVTLPGFFQATQQGGPQGGLSYGVANAPRGMSTNDMWAHLDSALQQAFILKGDMVGVQRAREYVFQMQHAGANQALMQAYGALVVGDAAGTAQLLAKSHAFVPDGSTMAFKVGPNNTLWGQRFVDATGQPVGGPMQITPQGIASMLNQTMDPQQFLKTLNTERQAMQKVGHDQLMAQVRREAIGTTAETADLNRAERRQATDVTQEGADRRLQEQLASREAVAEENRASREQIAQLRNKQVSDARRNQMTKETAAFYSDKTSDDYITDMNDAQRGNAQSIHAGMRSYTPDLQPKQAADFTKNVLNGSWSVRPTADGRLAVLDKPNNSGNVRAYLPGSMAQVFGRSPGETPAAVTPQPPAQAPAR